MSPRLVIPTLLPRRGARTLLGARDLNRALLQRQFLLQRRRRPVLEVLGRLVGLQAQATCPPYVGLWTRISGFRHATLTSLLTERQVVRTAMMRSTLHLVTTRDFLALRPLLQPVLDRGIYSGLADLDLAALADAARTELAAGPCTVQELGRRLGARWPGRGPGTLGAAARALTSLVAVPPSGTWGHGGASLYTAAEAWLGRPPGPAAALDELLLRYLAAFGPASARDAQVWSGLTGLRAVFERLRPHLRCFRDASGVELFDLPDARRPAADTPAPPCFLPEFDNVLLSHADRARILADADRPRVFTNNGLVRATVLVDGFVAATWKLVRTRRAATLRISPFARWPAHTRAAIAEEGERLLGFLAEDAEQREVAFAAQA